MLMKIVEKIFLYTFDYRCVYDIKLTGMQKMEKLT